MNKVYEIELVNGDENKSLGTVTGFDLIRAHLVEVVKTGTTSVWITPARQQENKELSGRTK
jgi:hypothetical protein